MSRGVRAPDVRAGPVSPMVPVGVRANFDSSTVTGLSTAPLWRAMAVQTGRSRFDRRAFERRSPAAITPGAVPAGIWRQRRRHRIEAAAAPWMAAAQARQPHPAPGPNPVPPDGFVHILRTGRQIAAVPAEDGRKRQLISPDEDMREPARPARIHCRTHSAFAFSPCEMGSGAPSRHLQRPEYG